MKGSTKVFLTLFIVLYLWFTYYTFFCLDRIGYYSFDIEQKYPRIEQSFFVSRTIVYAIPICIIILFIMVNLDKICKFIDYTWYKITKYLDETF